MRQNWFFSILSILPVLFTSQLVQAQINLQPCTLKSNNYLCAKDVSYGSDPLQKFDLWLPEDSAGKIPLVIYVHGGGYMQGDKSTAYSYASVDVATILNSGKAFATINYRLSPGNPFRKGVTGDHPVQMADSARALQYLRAHSGKVGVDVSKVSMTGGSAGGGITLWLALHSDLKNTSSSNIVDRQSTRVDCIALVDTQPTLNIGEVKDLLSPFGFEVDEGITGLYGITPDQYNRAPAYWNRVLKTSFEEASPMAHLTSDDAPKVMMAYKLGFETGDIHSPEFGIYLGEGLPEEVATKYNRTSLDELGLPFQFYHTQSSTRLKNRVNNFVLNQCP